MIEDVMSDIFNCKGEQLQDKFLEFVFGIIIQNEPFIRSVAQVDLINRRIYFYCDIDFC